MERISFCHRSRCRRGRVLHHYLLYHHHHHHHPDVISHKKDVSIGPSSSRSNREQSAMGYPFLLNRKLSSQMWVCAVRACPASVSMFVVSVVLWVAAEIVLISMWLWLWLLSLSLLLLLLSVQMSVISSVCLYGCRFPQVIHVIVEFRFVVHFP